MFFKRKREPSLVEQAEKANEILTALGLKSHTESGKQVREAIALELLSSEYDSIKGYKMGAFINQVGDDTLIKIQKLLNQEGILTRKIENNCLNEVNYGDLGNQQMDKKKRVKIRK